jgi:isopenicillin N synthase-like dioxygenase
MKLEDIQNYQSISETKTDLDWADLVTLDLSQFDAPGGKAKLAAQLKEAIHSIGFFYLVNFGLSQAEVDQQFCLAKSIFTSPQDEKNKYLVDKSLPGGPLGYKRAGQRKIAGDLKDNVELYDDPKYNSFFKDRPRPAPCVQEAQETEAFCRHIHEHILYRLLVLSAMIMELDDEEALWKMHNYEEMSNCHMRYMVQYPRTKEEVKQLEEAGSGEVIYGHTDFGTFTLLFKQPVAALQVRLEEEKTWKWVRPVPGSITVNVAVCLKDSHFTHRILTLRRILLVSLQGDT